jgi:phytoene synthase
MSAFEQELKARDPDRWLSSRFVGDPQARARLVALYSLDLEWARAAVRPNDLAAEIRLAWWREAVERFAGGGPSDHPALLELGRQSARNLEPLLVEALEAYADRRLDEAAVLMRRASVALLDSASTIEQPSVRAFPALAHLALAPVYARGRTPGEIEKRLRITWAVLRGRV